MTSEWERQSAPSSTDVIAVIDVRDASAQRRSGMRKSGFGMSTIDEFRVADKKVQEVLEALKKASAEEQDQLGIQLQKATDEYARVIRELSMP